jgi:hypothetical protein
MKIEKLDGEPIDIIRAISVAYNKINELIDAHNQEQEEEDVIGDVINILEPTLLRSMSCQKADEEVNKAISLLKSIKK